MDWEVVAEGLLIPEGPVALADGSVLIGEVGNGRISRFTPEGRQSIVAELDGGANGIAIGPDGAAYVCNNGGGFACSLTNGQLQIAPAPQAYVGGSIQRVDLRTGETKTLYTTCDGEPLLAPNDIVFDSVGGFWFTDHGTSEAQRKNYGSLCYAMPDGGHIRRVREHLLSPNGIGISPDRTGLYWADTLTARVWRAEIVEPGRLADENSAPDTLIATAPGNVMLDSLAVEEDGRICIGSIVRGGITVIDPVTGHCDHVMLPDHIVTNICFGGADMRDVWITAAGTGRLFRGRWPRKGLQLCFQTLTA